MANLEVLALDTAVPQIRAPGVGDGYTFPRDVTLSTGTANGVLYLNGSKVATSGSALTFDGTNLGIGTSSPISKLHSTGPITQQGGISTGAANASVLANNSGQSQWWGLGADASTRGSFNIVIARSDLTSSIEVLKSDTSGNLIASGNLGLGVTPSAWVSTRKAFQTQGGSVFTGVDTATIGLIQNGFNDGTAWKYVNNGFASRYYQNSSQHIFDVAASGTAGNAITFTQAMTLDASGNLLVNTTTSGQGKLMVKQGTSSVAGGIALQATSTDSYLGIWNDGSVFNIDAYYNSTGSYQPIAFRTSNTERARITAAGDLLVGTTTSNGTVTVYKETNANNDVWIRNDDAGSSARCGVVVNAFGNSWRMGMGSTANNSNALTWNIDVNSANTERMRLTTGGDLLVGKTGSNPTVVGCEIRPTGVGTFTADGDQPLIVDRLTNDGTLVLFRQANTDEGSISVSGNTVSYNPFMGSHYTEIVGEMPTLKGTVLESVDDLVTGKYSNQDRLPKAKISDAVGSKAVYGVYFAPDSDPDTDNGILAAALGASWVRVNGSVAVQKGDLLESNGDGTARVQADDIIRSSTIGKVTSTVKTHEYDDGSYCVPTVLYCG